MQGPESWGNQMNMGFSDKAFVLSGNVIQRFISSSHKFSKQISYIRVCASYFLDSSMGVCWTEWVGELLKGRIFACTTLIPLLRQGLWYLREEIWNSTIILTPDKVMAKFKRRIIQRSLKCSCLETLLLLQGPKFWSHRRGFKCPILTYCIQSHPGWAMAKYGGWRDKVCLL